MPLIRELTLNVQMQGEPCILNILRAEDENNREGRCISPRQLTHFTNKQV